MHTREGLDQRGLTRTVISQDAGDHSFADFDGHVRERDNASECFAYLFQFQSDISHRFAPFAFVPIQVLTNTAAKRMTPMKVQRQS